MAKAEKITVTKAVLIDPQVVEVSGTKGSRVPRVITVHFDRRHTITHGFQHVPDIGELGYMTVDGMARNLQKSSEPPHKVTMLSPDVVAAATKVYKDSRK